jgi:hypothetical protein
MTSGDDGFKYLQESILRRFDFDIFIYSNDLENRIQIENTYSQISADLVIGQQIDWEGKVSENGIDQSMFHAKEGFRTLANSLNFFYSRSQSIELAINYSKERKKVYDWIICSRFDLGQIDKYNGYQPFKVSQINFNPQLDNDYLYTALWNQTNAGIADQWIYGNQPNIMKLIGMHDMCIEYFKPNSPYFESLKFGIPFSNQEDEFSNEILHQYRKNLYQLRRVPISNAVDNHLIHKYYLLDKKLLHKNRMTASVTGVARVVYTHTDYADCWPIYFGQVSKLGNVFQKNYVLVNRFDERIPAYFDQIIYDEKLAYTDRVRTCLEKVNLEVIFFEHEDMILYDVPEVSQLIQYSKRIKTRFRHHFNPYKFDAIKMIRGGKFFSRRVFIPGVRALKSISRVSPWIFSIQPSFWSKKSLMQLLAKHKDTAIWDFESAAQKSVRSIRFRTALIAEKTKKRGESHYDSKIYPFIATAIVKGKWNTKEYKLELEELSREFEMDLNDRGLFN